MWLRECVCEDVDVFAEMLLRGCGCGNVAAEMWLRKCGCENVVARMCVRGCSCGNVVVGIPLRICGCGDVVAEMWLRGCGCGNVVAIGTGFRGQRGRFVDELGLQWKNQILSVTVVFSAKRSNFFPGMEHPQHPVHKFYWAPTTGIPMVLFVL